MSRHWGRVLLVTIAGVSFWVARGAAQAAPDTVTLRGVIVAAGLDTPVPYSIVELAPTFSQRFTDQSGEFAFVGLARGVYRLRARQIGYRPMDTLITVGPGLPAVRLQLLHLAIRLPAITVTGRTTCVRPGRPDAEVDPGLAAVFDQVLENAQRFTLLADSYPHRYSASRSFTMIDHARRHQVVSVDTVLRESWTRWRYTPGRVVGPPDASNERPMRLPTLPDFADSAFVNAHCFWLVGRDTIEGQAFIRVDFAPGPALTFADVAGTVYLDSLSFQLEVTTIRLTRPEQVLREGASLEATSRFREVYPGIPLLERVRAVQSYGVLHQSRAAPDAPLARVEEQTLLTVGFLRPLVPDP